MRTLWAAVWLVAAVVVGCCTTDQDLGSRDGGVGGDSQVRRDGELPPGARRVFVTRHSYPANLGLDGADMRCQVAADSAGLGGRWVAWLSTATVDALDRVEGEGPWFGIDGSIRFRNRAQLQTSPMYVIAINELGEQLGTCTATRREVWTGTGVGGRSTSSHCGGWNLSSDPARGTVGDACSEIGWTSGGAPTSGGTIFCSSQAHFYCFELP